LKGFERIAGCKARDRKSLAVLYCPLSCRDGFFLLVNGSCSDTKWNAIIRPIIFITSEIEPERRNCDE